MPEEFKQNNKTSENLDIHLIKIGKYSGEPYKLSSSFMPILTLESSSKFKFELGIGKSIEGTYIAGIDKLVLVPSGETKSYIFRISKNTLIITEEIPNYVKSGTTFKPLE